jgi:hypothetical protein
MSTRTTHHAFPNYIVFVSILAATPAGLACGAGPGEPGEGVDTSAAKPVPALPSQPSTARPTSPSPHGTRLR